MKIITKLARIFKNEKLLLAYLLVYLLMLLGLVLNLWRQYEVYYFNHGIFDQAIWNISRGKAPLVDHIDIQYLNQLGDHFTPSMYLLAPIYWVTNSYQVLLVVQVFMTVSAAGVMYLLSRKLFDNKLMSWALLVAFTWFLGLQNGLIFALNVEIPALLFLSLTFWFLEKKNWKLFWVFVLLTLGFKEIFASLTAALGVTIVLDKTEKKQGYALLLVSIVYALLVTRYVIPYFRGGDSYFYTSALTLQKLLIDWFYPWIKSQTISIALLNFGLLPLVFVGGLPLVLQDLFVRFVIGKPAAWDLGLHYSVMMAMIFYYVSIKGAHRLFRLSWYQKKASVHALIIFALVGLIHLKFHGPFGLAFNGDFYMHSKNMVFLDNFVNSIPNVGVVMTQNNLSVRLTHTHDVLLLRNDYWNYMPDVVALDIRDGQNPNNGWPGVIEVVYSRLINDPNYESKPFADEQVLFLRKGGDLDMSYYDKFIEEEMK